MPTKKTESSATATQTAATSGNGKSNPDLDRELLRSMLLQRRFEERCAEAYALGKIGGFCHLYIGQEAVSTGVLSILRPDDYIITTYRDHGQALARGIAPRSVMAELFGRVDGCARGKGGSRSEERRVGKECRSRGSREHDNEKTTVRGWGG